MAELTVAEPAPRLGAALAGGRWRLHRRKLTELRRRSPGRLAAHILLVLPVIGLVVLALTVAFAISLGSADTVRESEALLSLLLVAGLATIFAGSLSTTLQTLYLGADTRYLLSLPIPLRTVFISKLPEVALGSLPGVLFLISILAGQFLGQAAAAGFLLVAIGALLALLVQGICAATIVTAVVVRVAPPRFARLALLLVAAGSVVGMGLYWQSLAQAMRADTTGGGFAPVLDARTELQFTPAGWASEASVAATQGRYGEAFAWLGLLGGVSFLAVAAASAVFSRTLTYSLEVIAETRTVVRERRAPRWSRVFLRLAPRSLLPWVKREWMLIGRDLRRLSAAVWPVSAVVTVVVVNVARDAHAQRPADERFWLTLGVLIGLPWAISMGTTLFATGGEGRELGLLRSAPVRPVTVVAGKLFAYLVPIGAFSLLMVGLGAALLGELTLRVGALAALVLWSTLGVCMIDFASSTIAPNFGAEHVQRSTGLLGRILSTAASLTFLAMTLASLSYLPGAASTIPRIGDMAERGADTRIAIVTLTVAASIPALLTIIAVQRFQRLLDDA